MQRIPADARCFACDYLLRDLPEARCPECGRPFDPDNRSTVNSTGRPLGFWRLLFRPPGIILTLITLPAIIQPIWYARNPGHHFLSELSLLLFSVLAIAAWFTRLCAWLTAVARCSCPRDLARSWHWRWFVTPGLLFIAWVIPLDAISRFSFSYSRPALEEYAKEIMHSPNAPWPPRRVGFLSVKVTEASPSMVRFFCGPGYDGARCGYVYSPAAAPTARSDDGNLTHDHLDGPWYEYWDHTWPAAARAVTVPSNSATSRVAR